jgi:hypothetical protein
MGLTAEQADLRDAVRGLLGAAGAEPWPRLRREVGVAIPVRYGGAGAGPASCVGRPAGEGFALDGEAHHVLDGEAHYVLDGEGADVLLARAFAATTGMRPR